MATVVTQEGAVTHYLGLTDSAASFSWEVEPPPLPKHEPGSPLAKLRNARSIGVFICGPLINPLNGKTIGPDSNQVKALAFLADQGKDRVTLTVAEEYRPVVPGDVAAYPHRWDTGDPVLLRSGPLDRWWAPVSATPPPSGVPTSPPRCWNDPDLVVVAGGIEFRGWREPRRSRPILVTENAEDLAVAPPASQPADRPGPEPAAVVEPGAMVVEFIREHHAKVGRHDLDGFVRDYAASVDFNDKGRVDADFIRRDQAAYLPKYDQLSETIVGPIEVKVTAAGWRARYTIRSYAIGKRDGAEHDRQVGIMLDLRKNASGSLEIVRERATPVN